MRRDDVLHLLTQARPELTRLFAVKRLCLFGSTARDEAREDSDVDILVEFEGPATFDGYFGLLHYLEGLLGHPVDLVTENGLKERLRPQVEKEAIHVT